MGEASQCNESDLSLGEPGDFFLAKWMLLPSTEVTGDKPVSGLKGRAGEELP